MDFAQVFLHALAVMLRRPVSPLRLARTGAGLRIIEVAALVGVSEDTVWRWENGWHRPWPATRERLCKVLGQPEDVLFPPRVKAS